jgi:hypothetical protein
MIDPPEDSHSGASTRATSNLTLSGYEIRSTSSCPTSPSVRLAINIDVDVELEPAIELGDSKDHSSTGPSKVPEPRIQRSAGERGSTWTSRRPLDAVSSVDRRASGHIVGGRGRLRLTDTLSVLRC